MSAAVTPSRFCSLSWVGMGLGGGVGRQAQVRPKLQPSSSPSMGRVGALAAQAFFPICILTLRERGRSSVPALLVAMLNPGQKNCLVFVAL